jgi:protein SCO1/2
MRPRQTILLGLLLLVPVLAFLFLYSFGRNHYALPTYLPMRADSVRAAGGGWQRDTVYHQAHLPQLLDAAGRLTPGLPEQTGGPYVVQVLTAPGVAGDDESATRDLARLQETFRVRPGVRLATLVPMPAGENAAQAAARLQHLSEQYGTIAGKWQFLAAPADTLARVARYELGLTALRPEHLPFKPATEPGNLPAGRLLLLDRERRVRGYYDATDHHELERLITELNVLLYIYDHGH